MRVVRLHLFALILSTACTTTALLAARGFSADRPSPPTDDSPRCQPREDLACTVIRETRDGLVLVTKVYRPDDRVPPAWSLTFGPPAPATPLTPPPIAQGPVQCNPPSQGILTANGAPVLD